jgi:hypothetical protein
MSFLDGFRRTQLLTDACDLNILVWGPGSGVGEHFEKRRKIQDEVRKCFRNADVRFSEELEFGDALAGGEQLTISQQELWHLAACDVCIVLDTSKGAGEEIAHFVGSHMAYKLLILTHEKNRNLNTFPRAIREQQNQILYTDSQYESCSLVEVVLARIKTVALGKLVQMRV